MGLDPPRLLMPCERYHHQSPQLPSGIPLLSLLSSYPPPPPSPSLARPFFTIRLTEPRRPKCSIVRPSIHSFSNSPSPPPDRTPGVSFNFLYFFILSFVSFYPNGSWPPLDQFSTHTHHSFNYIICWSFVCCLLPKYGVNRVDSNIAAAG